MTPERLALIKKSLDMRQTDLTVVMENVRKPHNLAAVARTLEATFTPLWCPPEAIFPDSTRGSRGLGLGLGVVPLDSAPQSQSHGCPPQRP